MAKEKKTEKKVKEKVSKKVCPLCLGTKLDPDSGPNDLCSHCGGTGKYKEIK